MSNKLVIGYEDIEIVSFLESVDLYCLFIAYFLGGKRPEGMEIRLRLLISF